MPAYLVITYDVSDPERYADYNPAAVPSIMKTVSKHGGETVFAGPPDVLNGSVGANTVCVRFPDAEAAKAWLADDEYAPFNAIRMESTTNIVEFIAPGVG